MTKGFSKLTVAEKIDAVAGQTGVEHLANTLEAYQPRDLAFCSMLGTFSENVLGAYSLPFSVAPGFVINGRPVTVPLVTEESSVVAAISLAAQRVALSGGFEVEVPDTIREGHLHLRYRGHPDKLAGFFEKERPQLFRALTNIESRMKSRGGGIKDIFLRDLTPQLPGYYQLGICADTANAMGANFINTCLETLASAFIVLASGFFPTKECPEVVMAILTNYLPANLVRCSAPVQFFPDKRLPLTYTEEVFYSRFRMAMEIARVNIERAVTHNKGIMNGVDAVALATGNDFRAIEAGVHAYASRSGRYLALSKLEEDADGMRLVLELPIAVGTVGGITNLHPMAALSHKLLGSPSARELMGVMAATGLAANLSAVYALVTNGIQHGHMRMHLTNILMASGASANEEAMVRTHFADKPVSVSEVQDFLHCIRNGAPAF